ncbi:MAG: ADP-heptose:LPS heptosyltransferase [Candidatus Krumholzibacteriia bacterium]|jgi:ADP-heptose:LPS heptosyltransferase
MKVKRDFRRILLIRRKALGDALVTLPAVKAVAAAWPDAHIDLVIDRPFAKLVAQLLPEVSVVSWPLPSGQSWIRRLRQGRYDLVVDWLGNPRTAMWTALTGAPVRVGYDLPRRRWAYNIKVPRNENQGNDVRAYAGEAFFDPLRQLGLEPLPWTDGVAAIQDRQELALDDLRLELSNWMKRWLDREGVPVVVMMSATWTAKKWPAEKIQKLLSLLPETGANPILVTGPGDEWLLKSLGLKPGDENVAPPTNLAELAVLMSHGHMFVGTDCGPRHLAAALGLATVTIFGPTDPGGWNPATPRHVSVRHDVPCAPCNLTVCPVAGHPCLDDLESEQVRDAVARLFKRMQQSGVSK